MPFSEFSRQEIDRDKFIYQLIVKKLDKLKKFLIEVCFYPVTQENSGKRNLSPPNRRTYDLPITNLDALTEL